jgi:hypothetical protein
MIRTSERRSALCIDDPLVARCEIIKELLIPYLCIRTGKPSIDVLGCRDAPLARRSHIPNTRHERRDRRVVREEHRGIPERYYGLIRSELLKFHSRSPLHYYLANIPLDLVPCIDQDRDILIDDCLIPGIL